MQRFGVVETLHNWETGKTTPAVKHWPAIMDFLGYCPYQQPRTLGDRLRLHRMHQGLTVKELADILGVDPGSIALWETGKRQPDERSREMIERFLAAADVVSTTAATHKKEARG